MAETDPSSESAPVDPVSNVVAAEGTSTEQPLDPEILDIMAKLSAEVQIAENQRDSVKMVEAVDLELADVIAGIRAGQLFDHSIWTGALGNRNGELWVYMPAHTENVGHKWNPSRPEMESKEWRRVRMDVYVPPPPKVDPVLPQESLVERRRQLRAEVAARNAETDKPGFCAVMDSAEKPPVTE